MIAAQEEAVRQFTDKIAALEAGPRRVGRLVAHEGGMLEVTGFDYPIGYGGSVRAADGRRIRAEIAGFRGSRAMMVPLESDAALRSGARVEPDAQANMAVVGDALLGRIIGPMGEPLDGLGPIIAHDRWPLAGKRENVLNRGRVTKTIDLGVRAINALLTAGHGQRIAVAAGSGVGKSVLIGQIIGFAEADVIVVGLIGERSREVSDFVETKLPPAVRKKSVVVAVPADHPPLLRLRAAMRATAIAEAFRQDGKKVLLLIDSLTRVAHAQREIGLTLGEPPTMKGYPPSTFALIPSLVERAGNDRVTGGSITALYTVLADGGDIEDPVVDSARAIVDGHIILSRQLAEQGVYPAIDIARSLSRTMADSVDADHAAAAARFRQLWSAYEENRDLMLMGAYVAGTDPVLDTAIARRADQLAFVTQPAGAQVDFQTARQSLIEGYSA